MAPAPVAALFFVAPLLRLLTSNLLALVSLPLFPDYRVTVAAAPPERRERAKTRRPRCRCGRREQGERAVRVKGVRGARLSWRSRRRRAARARGARQPAAPRERSERAVRAVDVAAAPPEFSPSPLPRPACNAVIPVEKRPMIVTKNQLGRDTGEKGDKVSTVILSFVSFSPASLPSDSCPLSSCLVAQRSRSRLHRGTGQIGGALSPRNRPEQGMGR